MWPVIPACLWRESSTLPTLIADSHSGCPTKAFGHDRIDHLRNSLLERDKHEASVGDERRRREKNKIEYDGGKFAAHEVE